MRLMFQNIASLLCFVVIILLGCGEPSVQVQKERITDSLSGDTIREEYWNNKLIHKVGLKNGKFHGERYFLDTVSGFQTFDMYLDGMPEGPVKVLDAEGNLFLTGQHIKKRRVGNWYKYGENGVLQNITIYGFQGHEIQNIQFNEKGEVKSGFPEIYVFSVDSGRKYFMTREKFVDWKLYLVEDSLETPIPDYENLYTPIDFEKKENLKGYYMLDGIRIPVKFVFL